MKKAMKKGGKKKGGKKGKKILKKRSKHHAACRKMGLACGKSKGKNMKACAGFCMKCKKFFPNADRHFKQKKGTTAKKCAAGHMMMCKKMGMTCHKSKGKNMKACGGFCKHCKKFFGKAEDHFKMKKGTIAKKCAAGMKKAMKKGGKKKGGKKGKKLFGKKPKKGKKILKKKGGKKGKRSHLEKCGRAGEKCDLGSKKACKFVCSKGCSKFWPVFEKYGGVPKGSIKNFCSGGKNVSPLAKKSQKRQKRQENLPPEEKRQKGQEAPSQRQKGEEDPQEEGRQKGQKGQEGQERQKRPQRQKGEEDPQEEGR